MQIYGAVSVPTYNRPVNRKNVAFSLAFGVRGDREDYGGVQAGYFAKLGDCFLFRQLTVNTKERTIKGGNILLPRDTARTEGVAQGGD